MDCPVPVAELVLGLARWKVPVAPLVGALYQEGQRLHYSQKDPAAALVRYGETLAAAAADWRGLYLGPYLDILLKIGQCHRDLGDHATAVRLFELRQTLLAGHLSQARGSPWWPDRLSLVLTSDRTTPTSTPAEIREAVLAEFPPDLKAANAAELAASLWQLGDLTAAARQFDRASQCYLAAGFQELAGRQHRAYAALALRDGRPGHLLEAIERLRRSRLPLDADDLALFQAAAAASGNLRLRRLVDRLTRR